MRASTFVLALCLSAVFAAENAEKKIAENKKATKRSVFAETNGFVQSYALGSQPSLTFFSSGSPILTSYSSGSPSIVSSGYGVLGQATGSVYGVQEHSPIVSVQQPVVSTYGYGQSAGSVLVQQQPSVLSVHHEPSLVTVQQPQVQQVVRTNTVQVPVKQPHVVLVEKKLPVAVTLERSVPYPVSAVHQTVVPSVQTYSYGNNGYGYGLANTAALLPTGYQPTLYSNGISSGNVISSLSPAFNTFSTGNTLGLSSGNGAIYSSLSQPITTYASGQNYGYVAGNTLLQPSLNVLSSQRVVSSALDADFAHQVASIQAGRSGSLFGKSHGHNTFSTGDVVSPSVLVKHHSNYGFESPSLIRLGRESKKTENTMKDEKKHEH